MDASAKALTLTPPPLAESGLSDFIVCYMRNNGYPSKKQNHFAYIFSSEHSMIFLFLEKIGFFCGTEWSITYVFYNRKTLVLRKISILITDTLAKNFTKYLCIFFRFKTFCIFVSLKKYIYFVWWLGCWLPPPVYRPVHN